MDKMQVPSGFSFVGLAEIIKEVRELIKDLSYRNQYEKAVSNLAYAQLHRKYENSDQRQYQIDLVAMLEYPVSMKQD